jgi:predicted enzyme related to lactoylglutathione lyase
VTDVVWWEIETPAPEACADFCQHLFGWTFEPAFGGTELGADYWIVKSGQCSLGGLQRAPTGSAPPSAGTRLYAEVEDLELTLRRVRELGGEVERERTALGGADRWFAVIRDPGGVSFGLWTPHDRRPGA